MFFFHQKPSRKINKHLVDISSKCPVNVLKVSISVRRGKFEQFLIVDKYCKQTGGTLVVLVHISSERKFIPPVKFLKFSIVNKNSIPAFFFLICFGQVNLSEILRPLRGYPVEALTFELTFSELLICS